MNTCERHGRLRCGECAYIEQLEAEREKLIEVLRWYADEENQKLDESTRHWEDVYSPYEMDGGQRAREILEEAMRIEARLRKK